MKSEIEICITCPLGHKCETVSKTQDDTIERCAWYVELAGTDVQGNEANTWKCALAWQPILQLEMAGTNRGQTAALESFRNEVVKGTSKTNEILVEGISGARSEQVRLK